MLNGKSSTPYSSITLRVVEKSVCSQRVESLIYIKGFEESPFLILRLTGKKEASIQIISIPFSVLKKMKMNLLQFVVVPISTYVGEDKEIYWTHNLHIVIPFQRAEGKAQLPKWAISPILLRRERGEKGSTQERFLVIDIDMEGKEQEDMKVIHDYLVLMEVKAFEKETKGEPFQACLGN